MVLKRFVGGLLGLCIAMVACLADLMKHRDPAVAAVVPLNVPFVLGCTLVGAAVLPLLMKRH